MTFPELDPCAVKAEKGKLSAPPIPSKYIPRIYGFRVHQPFLFAKRQSQLHGAKAPQAPPPPPAAMLNANGQGVSAGATVSQCHLLPTAPATHAVACNSNQPKDTAPAVEANDTPVHKMKMGESAAHTHTHPSSSKNSQLQ